jgi:cytidine deaminase
MLPTLEAPELVFGICSPIGTNNAVFINVLANSLKKYNYHAEKFKVTSLMQSVILPDIPLATTPVEAKYDSRIKYANKLRELFKSTSVLSMMCCAAVRAYRRSKSSSATAYLPGHAYIFDQFKRREEIDALRQVYGRAFILVSIYSDKERRIRSLSEKIATNYSVPRPTDEHENQARLLARRDEDEEGEPTGQRLRDTFPVADLFVNSDDADEMQQLTDRFLALLFGANNVSPTREEYGMYTARSAALRSLDLSRQIGAAIFTANSEVVAIGCNEVPKAGGGTYWARDADDARDYTLEHDENDRMRRVLLADVVRRLMDANLLHSAKTADEIVTQVIAEAGKTGSTLRDALLMDLLEFGRIVHAEMSAISDAARLGRAVKDGTLYSTTFPCHLCAKHIVAAGIKKVVFIEPYPKSYAEDLHKDSIVVSAEKYKGTKVQFCPFMGVAPRRYQELFERGRRKDASGRFVEWKTGAPKPLVRYTVATYLLNEEAFVKMFESKLRELEHERAVSVAT